MGLVEGLKPAASARLSSAPAKAVMQSPGAPTVTIAAQVRHEVEAILVRHRQIVTSIR
jgi:hypothetical protein